MIHFDEAFLCDLHSTSALAPPVIYDEPLRGLKRSPPRCLNSRPHLLPDSLRPSSAEPQWNSWVEVPLQNGNS